MNWIDSKATFGDDCTHRWGLRDTQWSQSGRESQRNGWLPCREQLREQYEKYINRFGPGMIIYWFGFISDLQKLSDELLLAEKLPTDVVLLPKLNMSQLGLPSCVPQESGFG